MIIEQGKHFGHIDIASDRNFISDDTNRQAHFKSDMMRQFTVQAFSICDLL